MATLYWDLYFIANEQNNTLSEVWDGTNLKITCRRTVDAAGMQQWDELVEICKSISFSDEVDKPIWMFNPDGVYSVKSFYAIVNDPGVKQVHTPTIWNISIPPRIHIFLWLFSNNKLLSRDNLANGDRLMIQRVFCAVKLRHLTIYCVYVLLPRLPGITFQRCW